MRNAVEAATWRRPRGARSVAVAAILTAAVTGACREDGTERVETTPIATLGNVARIVLLPDDGLRDHAALADEIWEISAVGGGHFDQRDEHPHVVIGSAPGDGVRLVAHLDPELIHELRFEAIDLEGNATLRLAVDGGPMLWLPAGAARRLLVANATSIEAFIYQDAPFVTAVATALVRPHERAPAPIADDHLALLRDRLDPDLYLTAALDRIEIFGDIALDVDGELLIVRHPAAGSAGVLLGWAGARRAADPLPVVVEHVDGDVHVSGLSSARVDSAIPLTAGLMLMETDGGESTLFICGDGPFSVTLAAAGTDGAAVDRLLRRDRAEAIGTDETMATIVWSRDRVHRGTRIGFGKLHDRWQYLLLRRDAFVAICGSMSGLHQWMLQELGVPVRRVQFLGHRFLDGSDLGDTHVAVEAWIAAERRWILSDPTFACFWTHSDADPNVPLDTTALWHGVHAGHTPVPILSDAGDLPLPRRSPAEYYLPFAELFGAVEFTRARIPGPLGERQIPASRLGPTPLVSID